jgi:hypothetical protein
MLFFLTRLLYSRVRKRFYEALTRIEWNTGVISVGDVDPRTCAEAKNVRWLPIEGRRTYLADPFFLRSGDKMVLLAETIERRAQRGVIVAYEISRERIVPLGVALECKDAHLSYPFLFRWKGDIYCLPEQAEAGAVALYRAVDFPMHWERTATMLSGVGAVDPTVFYANSLWWLSYTEAGIESNTRLMLWYASEPVGPWIPHERNPIKIDPRSSRGAGAPFVYDGMLIRPAQDCSHSYGAKIVFNRIITITPTEFEEEVIGELKPDPTGPYPYGLHTISQDGELVVIDGSTRVFDLMAWYDRLRGRRQERRRSASRARKDRFETVGSINMLSNTEMGGMSSHRTLTCTDLHDCSL